MKLKNARVAVAALQFHYLSFQFHYMFKFTINCKCSNSYGYQSLQIFHRKIILLQTIIFLNTNKMKVMVFKE